MASEARKLNVLISGSSLSGNKGAMAMTLVVAQQMRRISPGCNIRLLSKYPSQDAPAAAREGIELVKAAPKKIVSTTLLRSSVSRLLHCRPLGVLSDEILAAYRQADVLVDLGGVTFSDDRDWKGLLLSVGWLMPALAARTPIAKLSQAMGPFAKKSNRLFARRLLKRCGLLIARGEATAKQVRELLGSDNVATCADVAFLLEKAPPAEVDAVLASAGVPAGGLVGVSLSAVVDRKAAAAGKAYRDMMVRLISQMRARTNKSVLLVPHADAQGPAGQEDREVSQAILSGLGDTNGVYMLEGDHDARVLKGIIARCDAFIACRFHAMVAAISSLVPTLVVGWGHKYRETMAMFGAQDFVHDFAAASADEVVGSFERLWDDRQAVRRRLTEAWPAVQASSMENFRLLERFLREQSLI